MKFSKETIKLLENFNTINTGIHFKKGHVLTSVHPQKSVMAQTIISEEIPQDFVIHSISTFLSAISLLNDPVFEFQSDKVVLRHDNGSISYGFADPSTVKGPPDKEVNIGTPDVKFTLEASDLQKILDASSSLKVPDLKIHVLDDTLRLTVFDAKDPTNHSYQLKLGHCTGEFSFLFKVANLKVIPGKYTIAINIKAAHFSNDDIKLQYWIALEKESKGS